MFSSKGKERIEKKLTQIEHSTDSAYITYMYFEINEINLLKLQTLNTVYRILKYINLCIGILLMYVICVKNVILQ